MPTDYGYANYPSAPATPVGLDIGPSGFRWFLAKIVIPSQISLGSIKIYLGNSGVAEHVTAGLFADNGSGTAPALNTAPAAVTQDTVVNGGRELGYVSVLRHEPGGRHN